MKITTKKKIKLGFKIAGGAIGIPVAASLTLAQIDIPTNIDPHYEMHKTFFRDTAKENANFVNVTLPHISMLGSHDALSDRINFYSAPNIYKTDKYSIYDLISVFGKGAIARFSKAQNNSIYEQLDAGVRYIDVRITHINGIYYNCHGLLSDTLENNLKMILQWLKDNPGEFVMFHIYYFYHDEKISEVQAWTDLRTYMETIKVDNKNLFDYDYNLDGTNKKHFSELTYGNICPLDETTNERKAGAVIFHKEDFDSFDGREAEKDLWCYNHIIKDDVLTMYHPCALRMDSNIVLQKTKASIATAAAKDDAWKNTYLRYMQTQTTPTEEDIGPTITAWSLLQKAYEHNHFMFYESGINWKEALDAMPIYMCDYATCNANGFSSDLLKLLSERNAKLA